MIVPLLEAGSLTSDESLAEKWAALLAAATRGDDAVPPSYPDILRQLTPREVAILDRMYEEAGGHWMESSYEPELMLARKGITASGDQVLLAADNLLRLRLVRAKSLVFPGATGEFQAAADAPGPRLRRDVSAARRGAVKL